MTLLLYVLFFGWLLVFAIALFLLLWGNKKVKASPQEKKAYQPKPLSDRIKMAQKGVVYDLDALNASRRALNKWRLKQ